MTWNPTAFPSTSAIVLLVIVYLCHVVVAAEKTSFCPHTLSRPTCPDLPTYDAFDISTYGGRWYEVGSSANFKNLQESGGICVLANYSLLQAPVPGKGALIGVDNTLYSLGLANHNTSQAVISLSAGKICSQVYSICAQVDETNSNSSLSQGIALVSNVSLEIEDKYPALAGSLASAKTGIEESMVRINVALDRLSKDISTIQVLTAQIGQGEGNAPTVATLLTTAVNANQTTMVVTNAVRIIESRRAQIESVASTLQGDSDDHVKLCQAAELILEGENAILAQHAEIQATLATVVRASELFLTPTFGEKGYNGRIVGTAVQDANFAGKLEVTFPGFPSGLYWILAVDGTTSNGGYAATLVYSCTESQGGGVEETLFVLSRTPSLPADSWHRLLAKGAALGVTGLCSTPFILTVQSDSCGNPPSDFLPSY